MPAKEVTCTLQLHDSLGQTLRGLAIYQLIERSQSSLSIDITIDASCARRLGTVLIMEGDHRQSPVKLKLSVDL